MDEFEKFKNREKNWEEDKNLQCNLKHCYIYDSCDHVQISGYLPEIVRGRKVFGSVKCVKYKEWNKV